MSDLSVHLKSIRVALEHLFLDPNNPRFAKSLNLPETVLDKNIPSVQQDVERLFINERDADVSSEEDADVEEGAVRIGDLIRSMKEIGFVPIDRVVVRKLDGATSDFVVIEGNRRVRSAKYLRDLKTDRLNPDDKRKHEAIVRTLKELDVLLLDTEGLSAAQIHDQIGVILGLRHFGGVLGWGNLARAVNIYQEYMNTRPPQTEFRLDPGRISQVVTRVSQTRSGVMTALKTYIAYRQLQEAFPDGQPKPSHYSLLQACVTNRKLLGARFIEQDGNTFKLNASSLENLNAACEFENRDGLKEEDKILKDPKAVSPFSGLISDATNNMDSAIKAFAASLQVEVLSKERTLIDAVDNLRSFKSDRAWTDSLDALLWKVVEPGANSEDVPPEVQKKRLRFEEFNPAGNDLLRLEEARKAFRNVRTIVGI